jgi:hypothetical protein
METTEFKVDHAIRNLFMAVSDLDDLRKSNACREQLIDTAALINIERERDRLSRILDDLGAK